MSRALLTLKVEEVVVVKSRVYPSNKSAIELLSRAIEMPSTVRAALEAAAVWWLLLSLVVSSAVIVEPELVGVTVKRKALSAPAAERTRSE